MDKKLTNAQLRRWVKYWQKELRIQDWEIKAFFTRAASLPKDRTAQVSICVTHMQAEIHICDRETYEYSLAPYDAERILVHELLHVRFADFEEGIHQRDKWAIEKAVNALGDALIKLKRGGEK